MHSSPYRTNSDFQLRYFIAGYCYTADGAFGVLHSLHLAQRQKVAMQEVNAWTDEIIQLESEEALRLTADRLEAAKQGDDKEEQRQARVAHLRVLAETRTHEILGEGRDIQAQGQRAELAAIEELLAEIEPHRRFSHLPPLQAIEASQYGEWLGELVGRGINYALGGILGVPSDHVQAMRAHPAWGEPGGIVEHLARARDAFNREPDLAKAMKALPRPDFITEAPLGITHEEAA